MPPRKSTRKSNTRMRKSPVRSRSRMVRKSMPRNSLGQFMKRSRKGSYGRNKSSTSLLKCRGKKRSNCVSSPNCQWKKRVGCSGRSGTQQGSVYQGPMGKQT